MDLDHFIAKIEEKIAIAPAIGAKIKFDFGDDGCIFVDGTVSPPTLSQDDGEADTVFVMKPAVFEALLNGRQDPTMAFMTGKLKVKGSMGYAMKINALLED